MRASDSMGPDFTHPDDYYQEHEVRSSYFDRAPALTGSLAVLKCQLADIDLPREGYEQARIDVMTAVQLVSYVHRFDWDLDPILMEYVGPVRHPLAGMLERSGEVRVPTWENLLWR